MRTVTEWLGEYGESHQNPTNKLLHWICVPPIVLSVMGLLWSAPAPPEFSGLPPGLNGARPPAEGPVGAARAPGALIFSLVPSPALALGLLAAFVALLAIIRLLSELPWPLWLTSI